jgi:hypothetical protein
VSPVEHWEVGEKAESLTLYEYAEEKVGEGEYVGVVAPGMAVVHAPSEYHWYESDGVPPEA